MLVLADEPTANLDTVNGQQAMEVVQRLNQETSTAFIFTTHDAWFRLPAGCKIQDRQIVDDGSENTG